MYSICSSRSSDLFILANFDWMEVNSPYGNALGKMQLHLMMVMMMMMVGGKMPLHGLSSYKDELI